MADLLRLAAAFFLVWDFVAADIVGHSCAAASRTASTILPPQRKCPHGTVDQDLFSAEPSAPSHVWTLVAKVKAALLLTNWKASAASASGRRSRHQLRHQCPPQLQRSIAAAPRSEDPLPDVFFKGWSGSRQDARTQRTWQLVSVVYDRGANMVHERWQREPPPARQRH